MNEQAEQALANLLNLAIDGIEGAKAFTEAQLPEVIEQLLMWKMLESLASTLFPFLLFALFATSLLTVLVKIRKSKKSRDGDGCFPYQRNLWWDKNGQSDMAIATTITLLITTFASLFTAAVMANLTWLQILVAPKVYLLEYASKLVS